MIRWEKSFAALLLISAAVVGPAQGQEQGYPQRPIRIIVGFGPGSGADTIARIVADKLSETFKAGVVVENKEGAGSAIAGTFVARAAPDGYTLLLGPTTMAVSPHMQASKPYNAVEDFVPVVRLAELPLLLVAAPTAPYKSLKEMIAYAKAHPG
ncbi:MAG: tripartite tricarboxylate transporter substrate-binding protein, partial [Burkholderiales bacterium]